MLVRLAGLDILDQNTVDLTPIFQGLTEKLGAIIRSDRFACGGAEGAAVGVIR